MLEANLCPSCNAPVHFAPGQALVDCPYCGTQVRLEGGAPAAAPGGPSLLEAIALRVGANVIPLIEAGQAVPLAHDETFSTQRDDQDALNLTLIARGAGADRELVALAFPITRRAPRGVPQIKARITVDAAGAAQLALSEPGTDNRRLVALGAVAVRAG